MFFTNSRLLFGFSVILWITCQTKIFDDCIVYSEIAPEITFRIAWFFFMVNPLSEKEIVNSFLPKPPNRFQSVTRRGPIHSDGA